jgi:hypothetical protein
MTFIFWNCLFPHFLTRISTHLWEITDKDDLEMAQLDWDGNKGVENLMGIYVQHPSQNFIDYFQTCPSTATLSSIMSQDQHEVSPHCAGLRKCAARKLELCAKSIKKVAMQKGVCKVFEVGEVVLVPLANVDKAKVDAQNLTGVIVENDTNRIMAQVVVKSGLLKQWYSYHKLTRVVGKGNNIELLGLQEAYLGWGLMKVISEQEASRNESLVGSQGKGDVTCNCKWACDSNRCSCFKVGRIGTSARGSSPSVPAFFFFFGKFVTERTLKKSAGVMARPHTQNLTSPIFDFPPQP